MARQSQPTPEQLEQMRKLKNQQFMTYSFENHVLAQAQNGTRYQQGRTLNFDSPIIASAYATKVGFKTKVKVKVEGVDAGGKVIPTASFPYSLTANQINISYGNSVAKFHPYLMKVIDQLEGYGHVERNKAHIYQNPKIDKLLNNVPTEFTADGEYEVEYISFIDLNQLHPSSVNGLLGIYSSGVRLQTQITLPSQVASETADPLDHAFEVSNGATVSVEGDIETIIVYRDNQSMTTRENLEPDLNGIPSVQTIQVPTLNQLAGNGSWNFVSLRNPYPVAKMFSIVIDGKSATEFADPTNIAGYTLQKADNMSSAFYSYDETNGGFEMYYHKMRDIHGLDLDAGVIAHDLTHNSAISVKDGGAYLNLTGTGYPAARLGVKLKEADNSKRTSRVVTFATVIGEGVQTR